MDEEQPTFEDGDQDILTEERPKIKKMKFRNYVPQNDALKEVVEIKKAEPLSIESEIKEQIDIVKGQEPLIDVIDLNTLAPRKVDWDLKKRIEKKLEKLEKRTMRAIDDYRRKGSGSRPTN